MTIYFHGDFCGCVCRCGCGYVCGWVCMWMCVRVPFFSSTRLSIFHIVNVYVTLFPSEKCVMLIKYYYYYTFWIGRPFWSTGDCLCLEQWQLVLGLFSPLGELKWVWETCSPLHRPCLCFPCTAFLTKQASCVPALEVSLQEVAAYVNCRLTLSYSLSIVISQ